MCSVLVYILRISIRICPQQYHSKNDFTFFIYYANESGEDFCWEWNASKESEATIRVIEINGKIKVQSVPHSKLGPHDGE